MRLPRWRGLLADPVFRRLCAGEGLVAATEALLLVALALLVLDVAGAGATVGLVLGVAAVPRALLLPFGGVLADRLAPSRVVVATAWLRTVALVVLAVLVAFESATIVAITAVAGLLGVLDAAYYPASLALLPRVVAPAGLARANALIQGVESAGDLFGPAVVAGIVAFAGLGGAFSVIACVSVLAALALAAFARRFTRTHPRPSAPAAAPSEPAALRTGLRFARTEPLVRAILLLLAVLSIAVIGPVLVGAAVLAEHRLGGTAALGLVFAGFGGGSLLGLLTAGARPPPRRGLVLILGTAAIGLATAGFGFVTTTSAAITAAAVIGIASAYLGVVLVAWLQQHVPAELRGRIMSLVVVATVAFDPLSYALAGALLAAGTTVMFTVCGAIVLLAAMIATASPTLRRLP